MLDISSWTVGIPWWVLGFVCLVIAAYGFVEAIKIANRMSIRNAQRSSPGAALQTWLTERTKKK